MAAVETLSERSVTKSGRYHGIPIVQVVDVEPVAAPNPLQQRRDDISETQLKRIVEQGFARGLADTLTQTKAEFGQRIWIIDNSGSMQNTDGHRIVPTLKQGDVKMVPCSRWEEIQDCINYHIQMAGAIEAKTYFRFLNNPGATVGPQEFGVAVNSQRGGSVRNAQDIVRKAKPGGCTPLTSHVLQIHSEVKKLEPQLRANGQRIVIVIATDGLPTDERGYGGENHKKEFVDALRLLEGLPVWVVIRLCTDEDDVVGFYNELDTVLELSVEVLDDFTAEAEEVYEFNPWLNYALPIHRMREMGYHDRVFDMLDERLLTKTELRDFCLLLFGESSFDGVPDPSTDWNGFVQNIERLLRAEALQWNPIKKKAKPWISIKKLHKCYGGGGGQCIVQ